MPQRKHCIHRMSRCTRSLVLFFRTLVIAVSLLSASALSERFNLRAFGGKGDNRTLNTLAFEAAVAAIREVGGGQLYVPSGTWLTTGFALTSNMSLFLEVTLS